jgi:ribosome-associated protein
VARDIEIRGDMIRLGQLLKLADVVEGGGEVKDFLAEVPVLVNGEPENRRGRQLHPGDVVVAGGEELRLVSAP